MLEDAWEKAGDQRRRRRAIEIFVRLLVGKLVGRLLEFMPFNYDRTQTDLAIRRRIAAWLAQNEQQTAARSERVRDDVGRRRHCFLTVGRFTPRGGQVLTGRSTQGSILQDRS